MFESNQKGYVRAKNEKELCSIIKQWLSNFCIEIKEEYEFDRGCIIDFWCKTKTGKVLLVEVKNWFVTIKDMQQLLKYFMHATELYGEDNFMFYVVAGGIEETRESVLKKFGLRVFLTKDLVKLHE